MYEQEGTAMGDTSMGIISYNSTEDGTNIGIESRGEQALLIIEQQGSSTLSFPLTLDEATHLCTYIKEVITSLQWAQATWLYGMDMPKTYNRLTHLLPKTQDAQMQESLCGEGAPQKGWYLIPVTEEVKHHSGMCSVCLSYYKMNQRYREGQGQGQGQGQGEE